MVCFTSQVEDRIGDVITWPKHIQQIIYTSAYKYPERLKICTFFVLNFVEEDLLINYLREATCYRTFDEQSIRNLHRYLSKTGEEGHRIRSRFYALDLTSSRVSFLNGTPRSVFLPSGRLGLKSGFKN
jgi:hypothetical protein